MRKRFPPTTVLLSFALLFASGSVAQQEQDFFAVRTLVVRVMDAEGSPVSGLGRDDFEVVERGVGRDIVAVDGDEENETEVVLLVDTSVAFTDEMNIMRRALDSFVRGAAGNHVVSIYEFGGRPRLLAGPTDDLATLLKGVRRLHAQRQEAAYVLDAVAETGRKLGETERKEGNPAHVVIVTATGPELSSERYERVKTIGESSGAVYHVVVNEAPTVSGDFIRRAEVENALTHLSKVTGGTYERVLAATGIERRLTQIAAELVPRYRISFLTEVSPESRLEELSVTVRGRDARAELIRLLPEEKKVPVSK